jgi:hypothetical protein
VASLVPEVEEPSPPVVIRRMGEYFNGGQSEA